VLVLHGIAQRGNALCIGNIERLKRGGKLLRGEFLDRGRAGRGLSRGQNDVGAARG
jgi:hypothetical protein